jgi:hypothetical protein
LVDLEDNPAPPDAEAEISTETDVAERIMAQELANHRRDYGGEGGGDCSEQDARIVELEAQLAAAEPWVNAGQAVAASTTQLLTLWQAENQRLQAAKVQAYDQAKAAQAAAEPPVASATAEGG